jgi:hypothetical protein
MLLVSLLGVALIGAGIVLGGLLIVVAGIHHEEKASSLTGRSPGLIASGARTINGVSVRQSGMSHRGYPQE